MSYDVRLADIDAVGVWIASYASQVSEQLSMIRSAAEGLASLESFQGAAADSVKAYWGEMHATAASSLCVALSEVAMRYAAYMDGYGGIDGARDARFEESALGLARSHFSSSRSDVAGKARSLSSAVASVSDLVGGWTPSAFSLDSALADLAEKAGLLDLAVSCHEALHKAQSQACDGLISAARAMVASLGSGGGGSSYVPGSAWAAPWASELGAALTASLSYQQGAAEAYQSSMGELQRRMQERQEEEAARIAEEREQQGLIQMGLTAVGFVVGAAVTAFTCGAAAPIVIGVAAVFAASDFVEGFQNFYYGSHGDAWTAAINPLRDTFCGGNQDAYDLFSFVVTVGTAGAAAPAMAATKAAQAVGTSVVKAAVPAAFKGAVVEVSREALVTGSASFVASRLTNGNQTAVEAAKIGSSAIAGMAFSKVSFKGRAPSVLDVPSAGRAGASGVPDLSKAERIARELQAERHLNSKLFGGSSSSGKSHAGGPKPFLADGSHLSDGALRPDVRYSCGEHGYVYETDSLGRIERVEVQSLGAKAHDGRLSHDPNTPGKLEGDHAGHLIADRFGGSPELDNLVSQAQRVNQSEWARLENSWAKALGEGKEVSVDIKVVYDGDGARPVSFEVVYAVNGKITVEKIKNG